MARAARPLGRLLAGLLAAVAGLGASGALAGAREPDPKAPLLSAWRDGELVVPRGLPAPWVPPSNPITEEKLALGRRLFFEPAMSRDRSKSCAHCHLPELAFTDGLATAVGVRGQVGARNVPSLLNAAIYPSLFWDGRAVSLESQAEGPLLAPTELDMTEELLVERIREAPGYGPLFAAAFGSDTVTLRRIAHALAAFQRTLLAGDAPFDRWWFGKDDAAISDAARRGYELFRTKGACAGCHSIRPTEAAFTDGEYHATGTVARGATDLGRYAVTGRDEDRGRFRTPTLRNVARTAPYFHDGSAATLAAVIEHYDDGGGASAGRAPEILPLRLTPGEKADLLAFLESLTSDVLGPPPPAPPASPAAPPPPRPAPGAPPPTPSADDPAALLAAPEDAIDPRDVRLAAEDALAAAPDDPAAWRALLLAVARADDEALLSDAIERARPRLAAGGRPVAAALGAALLRRARMSDPADGAMLREAEALLAAEVAPDGDPRRALDAAHARHLLGDVAGATAGYESARRGDDRTLELALGGLYSLSGRADDAFLATLARFAEETPERGPVLRWQGEVLERARGPAAAAETLASRPAALEASPRARVALARCLRALERHDEARAHERRALALGRRDRLVHGEVERLWREARPLASFADCRALDDDFRTLLDAVDDQPPYDVYYRNDLGFRLRDVVSTWMWRGEGRTQGLAEGAPAEARALLERCVAVYEEAVARIPTDAASRSFPERWGYASILNDTGILRHYWIDARDLDRAEAHYLRAFELTDGAYMDTYFYNLQYLYGFEKPGNDARWWRLARRASEAILKPTADGQGYEPDPAKREAARRDAEALRHRLDADPVPQPPR